MLAPADCGRRGGPANRDVIVGIKVRVGPNRLRHITGWNALKMALASRRRDVGLPLMCPHRPSAAESYEDGGRSCCGPAIS